MPFTLAHPRTDPVIEVSGYDAVRHLLLGAIRAMVIAVGAYVAITFSLRAGVSRGKC